MSHAAIVAREFGLPAIVGTKTATKLLKNGDVVMLNMLTGKIIKWKKYIEEVKKNEKNIICNWESY